ncbi:uncharacterized protein LOC117647839 [Thrips palmi]|uniref:Uncharacterized protein LOC117647839 n=1 Tax=Thrips palmi TaxID=161013 RepID=A0A6P8Z6T0_THRPL|nr:uncharacterized protein LOC117647839 [Thrips palmi]
MSFLRNESTDCPELFDIPHKNPSLVDDVLACAKFTKGAVMSFTAELALIDVWRENKEEYRRAHRDAPFYRKIASQLILRGHTFNPEQCKNKMDTLRQEFTLYIKTKSGDGAREPWP